MKKKLLCCLSAVLLFSVSGCGKTEEQASAPPEEKTCYILSVDPEARTAVVDEMEVLSLEDTERLEELGLDPDKDLPSGFFLYNEEETPETVEFSEDALFTYLDQEKDFAPADTDLASFAELCATTGETCTGVMQSVPHTLTFENGVVVKVTEQYIP